MNWVEFCSYGRGKFSQLWQKRIIEKKKCFGSQIMKEERPSREVEPKESLFPVYQGQRQEKRPSEVSLLT